jgi:hypothetical protein
MMRLSRAMHSFITLLCMVVIFLGLLLIPLVPWGPESAGAASVSWPAEVELLANQAVTQTAQYRFLNVVGAGECQHVYYHRGRPVAWRYFRHTDRDGHRHGRCRRNRDDYGSHVGSPLPAGADIGGG